MIQTNLVLVFDTSGENILLCMKKRGFGVGKYNGAGGKVQGNESIAEAAKRELEEETGINIPLQSLVKKGYFHFFFENKPEWNQNVTLYTVSGYNGEIQETEEMKPEWFSINDIPFDKMWEDDKYWMPRIIAGEEVEYEFTFDENGKIISHTLIK
ncbi:MAG: 8-oxo-dGTP diphosphatase [Candidatus Gracilibacteria bacterium]|nr:8-oxo-dGTP diphosphatase [Candidatus Gracilibacteria bacterium]MDD2908531.1 8-oxo-dGTP diphosphatase [Candidatus Gracilibacteria bacterium]